MFSVCKIRDFFEDVQAFFYDFVNKKETITQLYELFLVIKNHVKDIRGLFAKIISKVSTITALQYINYFNGDLLSELRTH